MSEQNTRTLQGKSDQQQNGQVHHCCDRASRETPNLWEVHHAHYQAART